MSERLFKLFRALVIKLFLVFSCLFLIPAPKTLAVSAEEPLHILIPSAQITLPVVTAKIAYNTWEVSETTASFGEGSSLPGTIGNTVIFAHARPGLFGSLPDAKVGELVYVFTKHDWYTYRVIERLIVSPDNTAVIQQSSGAELTLFTCTGPGDSHRLVLKAVLQ